MAQGDGVASGRAENGQRVVAVGGEGGARSRQGDVLEVDDRCGIVHVGAGAGDVQRVGGRFRSAVDGRTHQLRAGGMDGVVVGLAVDGLAGRAQRDAVVARAGIHGLHRVAGGDDVGAARTGDGQVRRGVGGEGGGSSQCNGLEVSHARAHDCRSTAHDVQHVDVANATIDGGVDGIFERNAVDDHRVAAAFAVDGLTSLTQGDGVGARAGIHGLHRVAGGDGVDVA